MHQDIILLLATGIIALALTFPNELVFLQNELVRLLTAATVLIGIIAYSNDSPAVALLSTYLLVQLLCSSQLPASK